MAYTHSAGGLQAAPVCTTVDLAPFLYTNMYRIAASCYTPYAALLHTLRRIATHPTPHCYTPYASCYTPYHA
jgi:hypothetical protein